MAGTGRAYRRRTPKKPGRPSNQINELKTRKFLGKGIVLLDRRTSQESLTLTLTCQGANPENDQEENNGDALEARSSYRNGEDPKAVDQSR